MKSFRKIQVIILSICLSLSTSFSMAGAHSGRTDAMGGHHDYQNKSGLGSWGSSGAFTQKWSVSIFYHITHNNS